MVWAQVQGCVKGGRRGQGHCHCRCCRPNSAHSRGGQGPEMPVCIEGERGEERLLASVTLCMQAQHSWICVSADVSEHSRACWKNMSALRPSC
eukprot:scaffold173488_cov24-Tisochrysis_lutea.AAC.1